jgi:hypothetical protein
MEVFSSVASSPGLTRADSPGERRRAEAALKDLRCLAGRVSRLASAGMNSNEKHKQ